MSIAAKAPYAEADTVLRRDRANACAATALLPFEMGSIPFGRCSAERKELPGEQNDGARERADHEKTSAYDLPVGWRTRCCGGREPGS
jgi:hypothetical protein